MFRPHRRERIAFLAENDQAWLRRGKAGSKRSKPMHFSEKVIKNTPKLDGRNRVWTAQARADRVFREIRRRQAGALKKRAQAQWAISLLQILGKIGRGENVCGPHRRERIAVLAESYNSRGNQRKSLSTKVKYYVKD